jgi:hypothetical protein
LKSSDGWQSWLRARSKFHNYSFTNQLLITMQRPEATYVTGFRKWLDLGYSVRRGEKALRLPSPRFFEGGSGTQEATETDRCEPPACGPARPAHGPGATAELCRIRASCHPA